MVKLHHEVNPLWRNNSGGKRWRVKKLIGRQSRFAGLTAAQWRALAVGVFLLVAVAVPGLMLVLSPQFSVPAFPGGGFWSSPRTQSEAEPQPPAVESLAETPQPEQQPQQPQQPQQANQRSRQPSHQIQQPGQPKPAARPEPGDVRPTAGEAEPGDEKTPPRKGQLAWPVAGEVVTEYGFFYSQVHGDWRLHPGIDIGGSPGAGVRAAWNGEVRRVSRDEEGWQVEVYHGGGVATVYGHLSEVQVREGEAVELGKPIGTVGAGGRAHFEVKVNGRSDSPLEWLSRTR